MSWRLLESLGGVLGALGAVLELPGAVFGWIWGHLGLVLGSRRLSEAVYEARKQFLRTVSRFQVFLKAMFGTPKDGTPQMPVFGSLGGDKEGEYRRDNEGTSQPERP